MHRFFIPMENVRDHQLVITDSNDIHHMKNALRLTPGDKVVVCDTRKNEYTAQIKSIASDYIVLTYETVQPSKQESPVNIDLYQGLPKSSKMDLIVEKTVELGIQSITPLSLKRCVAKIKNHKKEQKKLKRWNKIAKSASKQSDRGFIPTVNPLKDLDEFLTMVENYDLVLVPYEDEDTKRITALATNKEIYKSIAVVIGPEGGFTPQEIERLKESGAQTVSLGPRILRTETAGIAVTAILQYALGDIGESHD